MNYHYIVVEGSIGSGKSKLSRRLAKHFEALHLTESPERNPFLEQFYLNASNHDLATELFSLMHHAENVDIISTEEDKGGHIITDFLLERDQVFVSMVLKDPEQALLWELHRKVMPRHPVPDLVVYLQTSGEADTKRLQRRGDDILSMFPGDYLGRIQQKYSRFFHPYQSAPLLIVNADELDFVGNDEHFDMLFQAMGGIQGGHRYLNLRETV